ncbi:MAG: 50S ribosomal protein L17 [Bdellovibrionales bacterium]|nr:50S ribosomal protein L17 [Bdellovibrionales bacterium]
MRHQMQKSSSFGRHRGPRKALLRGLVSSLVEKERIKTTLAKAKCVQPLVEKAVTMGKQNNIHVRRLLFSRYPNKKTVGKIINVLSPRFKSRPGGYTRIIKLGFRSGDQAPVAYLEFVDYEASVKPKIQKTSTKEKKETVTPDKKKKNTTEKNTAEKRSAKKSSNSKKQKKQMIAKTDKKRKKQRQQQKKSRRINR